MVAKATLLDIDKRTTKYNKRLGIIANGLDNQYSERVERYLNNSVTAKTAAGILASYLAGKGFGEVENEFIVNKKKGTALQTFLNTLTRCVAKQNAAFIHVNYNANFARTSLDVIPYGHCRHGKKDDEDYSGKIRVYNNWLGLNGKINKTKISDFDVYNPDKKVIEAQVVAAGGWDKYKGQILYFNLDPEYDYALSKADPVLEDCDSEAQASTFKNKSLRKGFFGKTLAITKPLVGTLQDYDTPQDFALAQNERDDFKKTLVDFIGAENVGGALHVELENENETFEGSVKFENISSNIDDKIFQYTEESVFNNILMAFNNIPVGLVRSDNTLFGNNGDSLRVMKETYQENTSQERNLIENMVKKLMKNFKDFSGALEIIPLITIKPNADETNN